MVWQLSVKHFGEDRPWNFIFSTRKECIAEAVTFDNKKYKYRRDLKTLQYNEWKLNNREYMIRKIPFWYDGA